MIDPGTKVYLKSAGLTAKVLGFTYYGAIGDPGVLRFKVEYRENNISQQIYCKLDDIEFTPLKQLNANKPGILEWD